ncbi:BTAD domain-containing putative transcriptional regulator [Spirillospora sp. CA-294931]|uniref:AfsR/SARP family transcriptional regulator n=1 Tax=Spirillospora sp. CA-294931 TaxID=3240042 RepID=UPI003D8B5F81
MTTPARPLRFSLLGPPRGWHGDRELDLGSPQQRALLVVLLLREGRSASAQELVDAIWGERPPNRAVGILRTYASRLRQILEPGRSPGGAAAVLVTVADGYELRLPPEALDVTAFERDVTAAERAREAGRTAAARELLGSALGLWRGEPLEGMAGPFAHAQRTRLSERRIAALETRLELDLELGAHAEIIPELTALVAAHPLRERARCLLMLALSQAGRREDALAVYAEARRVLVDELGIEPGPELAELHKRLQNKEPPKTAPVAQLPGDVADFTGRGALIEELRGLLLSEPRQGVTMVALSGTGGVGKTALALHVAHQARAHFPDGQLYIDLRGTGEDPADPRTVLGAFLQALGVEHNALPDSLSERSALYRTRLAERRVLVLLDNARDAEQVRPLLPGAASCAVLLTSRAKLGGLGTARLIDLDVLHPDEAVELVARIAGRHRVEAEPEAAAELPLICGYLPLAVRVVAARLAARPSWTLASLVERLADRRRTLDELRVADLGVESVFRLAYNQLDEPQRQAFRLLSLHEGPTIPLPAAAALLGLPPLEAEDLCESLVEVSLLRSPTDGRYRYHDLLGLYARQRAEQDEPADERTSALHRLAHFYLATARNAHLLVNPGDGRAHNALLPSLSPGQHFEHWHQARAWLLAEAPSLFAIIGQAARNPAGDLLPLAAELLLMTDVLVHTGGHAHECEQAAYAVIDAAWERHDPHSEGRAHLQLGWVYYYADRVDDATAVLRVALRRARETGDTWTVADALDRLGSCARIQGHVDRAIAYFTGALDAFRECGDRHGEAGALSAMSRALLKLGRRDEAVAVAERGLAMHRELGGAAHTGYGSYQLGIVLCAVDRPEESLARLTEALEIFRSGEARQWEGMALFRMAEARLKLGRPEEALHAARTAVRVLRDAGARWALASALGVLADILDVLGRPAEARLPRLEALKIFERLHFPEAEILRDRLAR